MILGIDLGGSKVAFAIFTFLEGKLGEQVWPSATPMRQATPANYAATLDMLATQVQKLRQQFSEISAIGIGVPGAISKQSGTIKNANSTWLIGKHLGQDLEARIGLPVTLVNDANAFALAEDSDDADATFGVILGTGVGGGLVVNGRLLEGANGVAGEWGHLTLADDALVEGLDPNPMRPCYCGNQGCIETLLSGPGMVVDLLADVQDQPELLTLALQALCGDEASGLDDGKIRAIAEDQSITQEHRENAQAALESHSGSALVCFLERSAKRVEAMSLMVHGDEGASEDKSRFALSGLLATQAEALGPAIEAAKERYFARAIAALKTIVQVADPCIVLGGGVSKMPGLLEALRQGLPHAIFNAAADKSALPSVQVTLAAFGDDSGVRGAALIAAAASSSPKSKC